MRWLDYRKSDQTYPGRAGMKSSYEKWIPSPRVSIKTRRMVHDQFKGGADIDTIASTFRAARSWVEQALREAMRAADRKLKRRKGYK